MIYKTFIKLQIAYYRFIVNGLIAECKKQLLKAIAEDVKNKFYGEGRETARLNEIIKKINGGSTIIK